MADYDDRPKAPLVAELRYFRHEHLPAGLLRDVSANFAHLAEIVCEMLPGSAERTKALNELKIAKDWAVVAAVDVLDTQRDPTVHAERERVDSPDLVDEPRCPVTWFDVADPHPTLSDHGDHKCVGDVDHAGLHQCGCGSVSR